MSKLSEADVQAILKLLGAAQHLSEFRLRYGDIEIAYSRHGGTSVASGLREEVSQGQAEVQPVVQPAAHPAHVAGVPQWEPQTPTAPMHASSTAAAHTSSPAPMQTAMPTGGGAPAPEAPRYSGVTIDAPMVGTFYRAPSPGAPPFVESGQKVEPETVVCILEVMKLMNSITAGMHGTVRQILVGDSEAVRLGQPLMVIEPEA